MARSSFLNRQAATSDDPPKATQPVVYAEAGEVFPYRGTEKHGVDPTEARNIDPEEADYGTTVAVPIKPEEKEPDPVAVYVVAGPHSSTPLKTWGLIREYVRAGEGARMILGRDDKRSNTRIKNTHATDYLYLGPNPVSDNAMLYPVNPGAEFTLGGATTEVWAKAGATNDIAISIAFEREVET